MKNTEIKINVNINIKSEYEKRLALEFIEEIKNISPNETPDMSVKAGDQITSRSLQ